MSKRRVRVDRDEGAEEWPGVREGFWESEADRLSMENLGLIMRLQEMNERWRILWQGVAPEGLTLQAAEVVWRDLAEASDGMEAAHRRLVVEVARALRELRGLSDG